MKPHDVDRLDELSSLIATGRAREIREAAGLSRAAIALDLDVNQLTIARWEKRESSPRRGDALRYLRLLQRIERRTRERENAVDGGSA